MSLELYAMSVSDNPSSQLGCISHTEPEKSTDGRSLDHGISQPIEDKSAPSKGPSAESANPRSSAILLFALCIALHALLIIGCIGLIVLHFTLSGSAITFNPDRLSFVSGNIFYYATAFPNTIIKVYVNIPLLVVTQTLAVKRNVHVSQTLTSIHDKSSAWLGLGASAPVLWRYLTAFVSRKEDRATKRSELPAFVGVLLIAIYLLCGLLLGIIAPDLVTVGETVKGKGTFQNITSMLQGISNDAVQEAFPVVDIMPLLTYSGNVVTVGLQDSLIYDVPTFSVTASVPVSGTAFGVNCGQIPELSQVQSGDGSFVIHIDEQLQDVVINPASKRTLNVRPALWQNTSNTSPPPATLIIASTFPIEDNSQNANAAVLDLNSEIAPVGCTFDCGSVNAVQAVACNVFSKDYGHGHEDYGTILVETDVFPPLASTNAPMPSINQVWSNWSLPDTPVEEQSLLNMIGNFSQQSPSSRTTLFSVINGSTAMNYTLSMLEDNIMESLGYYNPDITVVHLSDLEDILSQAVAAVFWRAALRAVDSALVESKPLQEYAIQISKWSPILGLVVSTVMLVVAVMLTWLPKPHPDDETRPQVDSFGVLELMWYLGQDRNHLSDHIAQAVPDPTLEHLRDWGKKERHRFADDDWPPQD